MGVILFIDNRIPTVEVNVDVVRAKVGSVVTLTVTAHDDDVDDLFTHENVLPDDATFNFDTGVMTWQPQTADEVGQFM